MPLNISIDVDGTLLDENERPVPQARESLQLLKNAGHCLQLWSAGGADGPHACSSSVRSEIFVATHATKFPSPVGAAYSAPDGA